MAVTAQPVDTVIGRERELAAVSAFLDSIPRGPRALLLEGEAGIGKTTIWFEALAKALGYQQCDASGQRRTISLAQYSRRLRGLGLLPYFLIFIALGAALLRMGVIKGWDLIIDS